MRGLGQLREDYSDQFYELLSVLDYFEEHCNTHQASRTYLKIVDVPLERLSWSTGAISSRSYKNVRRIRNDRRSSKTSGSLLIESRSATGTHHVVPVIAKKADARGVVARQIAAAASESGDGAGVPSVSQHCAD